MGNWALVSVRLAFQGGNAKDLEEIAGQVAQQVVAVDMDPTVVIFESNLGSDASLVLQFEWAEHLLTHIKASRRAGDLDIEVMVAVARSADVTEFAFPRRVVVLAAELSAELVVFLESPLEDEFT
jgi:hypothetical protein